MACIAGSRRAAISIPTIIAHVAGLLLMPAPFSNAHTPAGHYIEYRPRFAVWYNSHHAFPMGCCLSDGCLSGGVGVCVKPRNRGRIARESDLVSSSQSRSGFLQRTVGPLRRRSFERQTIKGRSEEHTSE